MKRIILTYGGYFERFMSTLKEKEQEKIQYGLLLLKTQDRLPMKFIKFIRDGLYELRTEYGGNISEYSSYSTKEKSLSFLMVSKKRVKRLRYTK